MRRVRNASKELVEAARDHRKHPTAAERLLWSALRGGQLDLRFRRQHPVGRHILDFYCPAAKLAIEVDGDFHDLREAEDRARTEEFAQFGYAFIRFRNEEILTDLPDVLSRIRSAVEARLAPLAHLAPKSTPLSRSMGEGGRGGVGSPATAGTAPPYAPGRPPPPWR